MCTVKKKQVMFPKVQPHCNRSDWTLDFQLRLNTWARLCSNIMWASKKPDSETSERSAKYKSTGSCWALGETRVAVDKRYRTKHTPDSGHPWNILLRRIHCWRHFALRIRRASHLFVCRNSYFTGLSESVKDSTWSQPLPEENRCSQNGKIKL